jgi:hypothetical protein
MSQPSKETVILVHGTYAAPVPGTHQWYQPPEDPADDSAFVAKLDAALQRHGSNARCWAHLGGHHEAFHWTSENSWLARSVAAAKLATYVHNLTKVGWTCHLVAHSHGGNVLLDSYPILVSHMFRDGVQSGELGRTVTLGTPFMDTHAHVQDRRRRMGSLWQWSIGVLGSVFLLLAIAAGLRIMLHAPDLDAFWADPNRNVLGIFALLLSLLGGAVILRLIFARLSWIRSKGYGMFLSWDVFSAPRWTTQPMLAINSSADEVAQILHLLLNSKNLLAPKGPFWRYLLARYHAILSRRGEIESLYRDDESSRPDPLTVAAVTLGYLSLPSVFGWLLSFALGWTSPVEFGHAITVASGALFVSISYAIVVGPPFFSTAARPFSYLRRHLSTLTVMPQEATAYLVRKRIWSLAQRSALGLEAYPDALPKVSRQPNYFPSGSFLYEELPQHVSERALDRRDTTLGQEIKTVTSLLERQELTAGDVSGLLRDLETNVTLVHAAYYTDDESIDRIARWIAGRG